MDRRLLVHRPRPASDRRTRLTGRGRRARPVRPGRRSEPSGTDVIHTAAGRRVSPSDSASPPHSAPTASAVSLRDPTGQDTPRSTEAAVPVRVFIA
jgi:hypothetical protein